MFLRILVVEDEKYLNETLKKRLLKQGYSVDSCADGLEAKEYIEMTNYDCILLDIMLPGMSGMDILSWARKKGVDSAIIMLTARDAVEDKVKGLDCGADDYLTKPFSFDELMARIRMVTRKRQGSRSNEYAIADLKVDTSTMEVLRAEKKITLTAKEFALLSYLIANQGKVLTRRQIEENLWDYDYEGASNMVDVYIRYLRKKIDDGFDKKLIHTVRGVGYTMKDE